MSNTAKTLFNTVTAGRAIEFAEYYAASFPEHQPPDSHEEWGKDILQILTGNDDSMFGEIALRDPMRIVFAELSQDKETAQLLTDQFVHRFHQPMWQSMFVLDEHNRLLTSDHPDFDANRNDLASNDATIITERAEAFLKQQCDGLFNTCYDVFTTLGEKIPTGEALRNIRLRMNAATNKIELRPANPLEQLADATFGRIRDARSGSLPPGSHAEQLDALANWLVGQPVFRPVATKIAECYSSFMMPDPDQNHSTVLMQWRANKQKKKLERALNTQ